MTQPLPSPTSRTYEDEFAQIARSLGGDAASRDEAGAWLAAGPANYHGAEPSWDLIPKIFDRAATARLACAAETMGRIMEKATRRFIADPSYRSRYRFPARLNELVCAPTGYPYQVPCARVDLFYHEDTGDFRFCEINTDGTSGFLATEAVTRAIMRTETFRRFAKRHPSAHPADVFGAWIDALIATWEAWEAPADVRKPALPALAVVDYGESVSGEEVGTFCERFAARGIEAHFTDVRALRIEHRGGRDRLVDDHGPIDCVWKRAVTGELAEKPCPGADALARALEGNLACLVGSHRTWVTATKTFFALLWDDTLESCLSAEERAFVRAHVPETHFLYPDTDVSAFADRARWIAKPAAGYNSVGVVAGLDATAAEWDEALRKVARQGGIVQAYAPQYDAPTIPNGGDLPHFDEDPLDFPPAHNMEGLFLFNGKFCGTFNRCGFGNVIGEFQGRLNQGALYLDE